MTFSIKNKRFQNRSYGRLVALQTLYQEELNPGAVSEYGDNFVYSELNQLCLIDQEKKFNDDSIENSEENLNELNSESEILELPVNDSLKIDKPLLYHELLDLVHFVKTLIEGTRKHQQEIDAKISDIAANWSISRMTPIDRNILRMSIYEMIFEKTPKAIVISEAIELAKRFGTKDSINFINGILDKITL